MSHIVHHRGGQVDAGQAPDDAVEAEMNLVVFGVGAGMTLHRNDEARQRVEIGAGHQRENVRIQQASEAGQFAIYRDLPAAEGYAGDLPLTEQGGDVFRREQLADIGVRHGGRRGARHAASERPHFVRATGGLEISPGDLACQGPAKGRQVDTADHFLGVAALRRSGQLRGPDESPAPIADGDYGQNPASPHPPPHQAFSVDTRPGVLTCPYGGNKAERRA